MQSYNLDGPRKNLPTMTMTNFNPHTLMAAGHVEDSDAWQVYMHAKNNWLTVYKYAADKAASCDAGDEYTNSTVLTFDDGSQLLFAK